VLQPVELVGDAVRLVPLDHAHADDLIVAVEADGLMASWVTALPRREDMAAYIATAQAWQRAGHALAFAVIERASGRAVGSTRFGAYEPAHRRVEIGWTWLARRLHGSVINTEMKWLMLRYAFEALRLMRVEFKTDVLNDQSRTALGKIGAREEGVLRKHMLMQDGRVRDSIYFSITDDEWPEVDARLRARRLRLAAR
jgi:RimJ/RimL family protein N-acetyltransferase